jgi:hypothetical protein
MVKKFGFRLDLDGMFENSYYYTQYDIGGEGHAITILEENKELFLNAFAAEWRKRAEEALEDIVVKIDKQGNVEVIEK